MSLKHLVFSYTVQALVRVTASWFTGPESLNVCWLNHMMYSVTFNFFVLHRVLTLQSVIQKAHFQNTL